jgi:putative restriction endonuclease
LVKVRVNQKIFWSSILAAYNNTCCITGIDNPDLLVAGHIVPWSADEQNRMNPRNGIAINTLHDRAFELGYVTIIPEYTIRVSPKVLNTSYSRLHPYYFQSLEGKKLIFLLVFFPIRNF